MIEPKILSLDSSAIDERFARIRRAGKELRPAMNTIGEIGLASIEENFQAQGRYSEVGSARGGSRKWAPLAASTKRGLIGGSRGYRLTGVMRTGAARLLKGKKILSDTGSLSASTSKHVTNAGVTLGTNKAYAAAHNFGVDKKVTVKSHTRTSSAGKRYTVGSFQRDMRLPARPFMVIQDRDVDSFLDILDDHITR